VKIKGILKKDDELVLKGNGFEGLNKIDRLLK
jgi:hypothetical protein